ncbi:protein PIH1D3 [Contarinia nasturtii]|uniref:protein PIH1D3 n=1 Tax=Contarinia nasturtii TaxID=265458 RepID=UPI0012D42CF8|nr:protein PIH1D3 [Contarinia nasturtii]
MDFFENPNNLRLIQDLLKKPDGNSSESEPEDDRVPSCGIKFSTSNLKTHDNSTEKTSAAATTSNHQEIGQRVARSVAQSPPKTLFEWERQEALVNDTELEDRLTPEYRIVYKQSVTPEDMYLQIGNKTAATASCEEMCLEIILPNETVGIDRMQLDVTTNEIDLQTPMYRLKLPLTQPTDPDRGKAHWDSNEKILRLTLRMKREYDFINF